MWFCFWFKDRFLYLGIYWLDGRAFWNIQLLLCQSLSYHVANVLSKKAIIAQKNIWLFVLPSDCFWAHVDDFWGGTTFCFC